MERLTIIEDCGHSFPDGTTAARQPAASSWRLAHSLDRLRDQINAAYPERDVTSDGTIGDQAHASRKSDHNPNGAGVVTALDITDDDGLVDSVWNAIRRSRDPRVKYAIHDGRIFSSYDHADGPAWTWRPYSGSNPHTLHGHLSVSSDPALYDDPAPWQIGTTVSPSTPALAFYAHPRRYDLLAALVATTAPGTPAERAGSVFTTDRALLRVWAADGCRVVGIGDADDLTDLPPGADRVSGRDAVDTFIAALLLER